MDGANEKGNKSILIDIDNDDDHSFLDCEKICHNLCQQNKKEILDFTSLSISCCFYHCVFNDNNPRMTSKKRIFNHHHFEMNQRYIHRERIMKGIHVDNHHADTHEHEHTPVINFN